MPFVPGSGPKATEVPGLVTDSYVTGAGTPQANPAVAPNRQLCFYGQTGNSAATSVANQQYGVFTIPAGTVPGQVLMVPNTLVGAATSSMLFQLKNDDGGNIERVVGPLAIVDKQSFSVKVICAAPVVSATDVTYLILN